MHGVFGALASQGVASLIVSVGLSLIMFARDTYHLEGRDVKWVLLRGLTAGASYMLTVCAVQLGIDHRPSGGAKACRGSDGLGGGPQQCEHNCGGSPGAFCAG